MRWRAELCTAHVDKISFGSLTTDDELACLEREIMRIALEASLQTSSQISRPVQERRHGTPSAASPHAQSTPRVAQDVQESAVGTNDELACLEREIMRIALVDSVQGSTSFSDGRYPIPEPFQETNVPGDGDCLFHAICRSIRDNRIQLIGRFDCCAPNIRARLIYELRTMIENDSVPDFMTRRQLNESIRRLRRNEWGENFEVSLISYLLRIRIYVFDKRVNQWVRYTNGIAESVGSELDLEDPTQSIYISGDGAHFQSLCFDGGDRFR